MDQRDDKKSIDSDQILDVLLDLERAKKREQHLRTESDSMLDAMRAISFAQSTESLFQALVSVLKTLFSVQDVLILVSHDGVYSPVIATSQAFMNSDWPPSAMLKQVCNLSAPVALNSRVEIQVNPDWGRLPEEAKRSVGSAIHLAFSTERGKAILVCTSLDEQYFSESQIKELLRVVPLVSQAWLTLDLRRSVAERDRFFALSADLMAIVGFDGRLRQFNRAWCQALGVSEHALEGTALLSHVYEHDRTSIGKELLRLKAGQESALRECRMITASGGERWFSIRLMAYLQEKLIYVMARDVTERVSAQEQLYYDARHDALTGLLNRAGFIERLNQAISQNRRHGDNEFSLLFLDLDRFKIVNDSLGHVAGDDLLKEVTHRLREVLRTEDIVGRIGGDEFVILLTKTRDPIKVAHTVERIQTALKRSIQLRGQDVVIESSIGITMSGPEYTNADAMFRDADTAMNWAKHNSRSGFAIFDATMHEKAMKQLQIEADLRRAIENEELELYFQPMFQLDGKRLCGFEALLRWNHKTKGLISPLDFIPVAEESGLIVPIGQWVVETAMRHTLRWQSQFPQHGLLPINVNVSPRQFWDMDFVNKLKGALLHTKLSPKAIALEITEGVIMHHDDNTVVKKFHDLKELGFNIYIDDFGTGYSSLSYLHRFPFDGLKIDRSFIRNIQADNTNRELVSTILLLAHKLKFHVVAEGIEEVTQENILRAMSCGIGQGFLYSKPLRAPDVENLLAKAA